MVEIAATKLTPLKERLKEKYRIKELVFEDEQKALLAFAQSVDRTNGGRGVLNEMVTRLFEPLAKFLFEEEEDMSHYAGRSIRVIQAGNQADFVFRLE